nr:reverse transcriptase domain-containing protein [Tanacetum cinerariifolium]
MVPATAPLNGFHREIIWPMRQILLLVKIGDVEHSTSTWMNFVLVRSPSPYNGIIIRPQVRKIQAVPSTAHRILKFPVSGGRLTLQSSRIIPLECTMVFGLKAQPSSITQAAEERIRVAIHTEYQEQKIVIGCTLTEEGQKALCELLRHNLDIFAWKPEDITRVPRHLAEHRLNVREGCLSFRQKKRSQALNLEVYVDNLVIKSTEQEIIRDIEETFRTLREINMKLNPKKCTFGVKEGMFLGYKVNTKGIKVCPAEAAFKQMKKLIAELLTLTTPMEKEELIVYLTAAREAVSAMLMIEREAKQMPVGRAMQDPKIYYTPLENWY